mgnify:CR=1 FL=1
MEDANTEVLKHRLRLREILLDKLVLALLLVAAAFYANQRLAQQERIFSGEMEQLRSLYDLQRQIDQREVGAHERAWMAVSAFSAFVTERCEESIPLDPVQAQAYKLFSALDVEKLYLTPVARSLLDGFFSDDVPALIDRWSGPSGRGTLSAADLEWFHGRVEMVRTRMAAEIQAKRRPHTS